jgi:fatty acid-binding protein DegV
MRLIQLRNKETRLKKIEEELLQLRYTTAVCELANLGGQIKKCGKVQRRKKAVEKLSSILIVFVALNCWHFYIEECRSKGFGLIVL